jgi:hypothetical protein
VVQLEAFAQSTARLKKVLIARDMMAYFSVHFGHDHSRRIFRPRSTLMNVR